VAGRAQGTGDIQYFPERKVWVLQAGETTYAFGVNERGELQSIYWGRGSRAMRIFRPRIAGGLWPRLTSRPPPLRRSIRDGAQSSTPNPR
jgi:hypothetical protein